MDLGPFSISLNVQNLGASRAFYQKMGFSVVDGNEADNWLILRNGEAMIGIFQGKFESNVLTFNPSDVRSIQRELKGQGLAFALEADESTAGPAAAALSDPDGNFILLDQHNE